MYRIGQTRRLVGTLALVGSTLLTGAAGTVQAAPAQQSAAPLRPVTIANFGPFTSEQPGIAWVAVDGAWVGFAQQDPGYGHHLGYITDIHLQNIQDSRRITIHTAVAHLAAEGVPIPSATDLHLQNGKLWWQQPGGPLPAGNGFTAGTYTCTRCAYDLASGVGGPVDESPAVGPDWTATVAYGPNPSHVPLTLVVAHPGLPDQRFPLNPNEGINSAATDGQTVVYWSLIGSLAYPHQNLTYPLQVVRVATLTPPAAAFATVWAASDAAVAAGTVPRTWLWGPKPLYSGQEAYAEGANQQRAVVYYDKSRMEINQPSHAPSDPYYVSNGLLVAEMIGGQIQVGDSATIAAQVACQVPVVGDPRTVNPNALSYSDLRAVTSLHGDHQATARTGQAVAEAIDRHGTVSPDPAHAALTHYRAFSPQTGHNIPDRFWSYLQALPVPAGADWTYVTGYPISEAYWAQMRVKGQDLPVLIQAYQRRLLTYVPGFAPEWQVQQGT